ncbi:DMT family transporter [Sinosporangium siamense]|uniref:Membrane protein n=1 Tax=Sinosporangium siamense TaxID=1367973 RepID=A0A919RGN8_9ACTN|nr:EamA family transporter [Sinosporangium siamense]GII93523.1 membrane protein [Sinosporangium siamense]
MTRNGPLLVIAAAMLWGTAGTVGTLALQAGVEAEPRSLAAVRLLIGGGLLAALAGAAVWRVARRHPVAIATSAAAVAAYQLCYFAAVAKTGVAVATVVAIGSGPVFTGVLSYAVDRVRPTGRWAVATVAAVAGSAVLILSGDTGSGNDVVGGVSLALLGGLVYAFYAVTAARVIAREGDSNAVMGAMFGGAAVFMSPVLLWTGSSWLLDTAGLTVALYLGLATTALAYFMYGKGLRSTPVASAATLALAEPAVAAVLGFAVLGERLTAASAAALVLLGVALVVVALPERAESTV